MQGMSNQAAASSTPGPVLPAMFDRYKVLVEQGLAAAMATGLDDSIRVLLQYHLGWGDRDGNPAGSAVSRGKALRPTLCLFACEALNGNPRQAMPAAAAIELIHNFSLIHDDIQDQDLERRHQATVWALWGQPKALAAGEALHTLGDLAALQPAGPGVSEGTRIRVTRLLTEGCLEMIEGQCLDLGFESQTAIATEEYLRMIACKTGALIRSSLEIGAALATEDRAAAKAFANFGSCLGRAFQIRDDYLGVWGDESATGKSSDNDIRRRKKSFPAVFALEQAAGATHRDLLRIYRQEELSDADVARVMAIMDEVGAPQYARQLTQASARQAAESLEGLSLPSWARAEVELLVDFLANRQF